MKLLFVLICLNTKTIFSKSIYVSKKGYDWGIGDLKHPFKNIDFALKFINEGIIPPIFRTATCQK